MKKDVLVIAGLMCMMSLTACGGKEPENLTPTGRDVSVESQAETTHRQTVEDTMPDIQVQIEQDMTTEEVEEIIDDTEPSEDSEGVMSIVSDENVNVGVEQVEEVGILKAVDAGTFTIDMNGMLVEAFTDDATVLEVTEDNINQEVVLVYDGVQTRSIPAQVHTVFEIRLATEEEVTEEGILESETVTEVENSNEQVIVEFTGKIVEISEDEILFESEDRGNIIANISDITNVDEGLVVGDEVIVKSSDVMTMSEPGILAEVYEVTKSVK